MLTCPIAVHAALKDIGAVETELLWLARNDPRMAQGFDTASVGGCVWW
jgi:hypothetical protein